MSDRKKVAALFGELSRVYAELCREMGGEAASASAASGGVAPAFDLDSAHGDPVAKITPKGLEAFKGRRFSECSADALDAIAEQREWFANNPKEGKEKYAAYDRKDAARARGWAARIRNGWKPAEPSNGAMPGGPMPGDPMPGDPMGDEDFT